MKKFPGILIALATAATVVLVPAASVNASPFSSSSSSDGGVDAPAKPTPTKPPVTTTPKPPVTEPVVEPKPFNANGLLGGTAQPNLPDGERGKVSVVKIGELNKAGDSALLTFAFRNNTNEGISSIRWTATARSGGQIVATGSSQGIAPVHVQPGEIGLGHIYFTNGASIPDGADYEFTVSTRPVGSVYRDEAQLTVTEANISGDAIVGSATNRTGAETSGSYSVLIYCFDGDNLLSRISTFAEQKESIADGGTVTFAANLYGRVCPSYAVGVSGYNR